MANTNRRYINRNGQMFIPMNVEGGAKEDNFITSNKVIGIIGIGFADFIGILWVSGIHTGPVLKAILVLGLLFITQILVRRFIFEEKYFYRMYLKMKDNSITTPALFWDVANIKDTDDGAIIVYSDMKIGVLVRVERDTITGKAQDFKETHFDAISDFYKELNMKKYKFIQMNIMEQAGKDSRLQKLDELVTKSDNQNISKLIEMQVGHIKNITRSTLFESDYFLIYTDELYRSDAILTDVVDCIYKLLDGGFISFRILSSREILDMIKEMYGVKYFDYTEAILNMFKSNGMAIGKAFNIKEVHFESGDFKTVDGIGINRLNILASYIMKNDIKHGDWTIRDALNGRIKNSSNRVGLNSNEGLDDITSEDVVTKEYIDLDNLAFGVHGDKQAKVNKVAQTGNKTKEMNQQQEKENKNATDVIIDIEDENIDF